MVFFFVVFVFVCFFFMMRGTQKSCILEMQALGESFFLVTRMGPDRPGVIWVTWNSSCFSLPWAGCISPPWALVFCVGLSWGEEQDGDVLTPLFFPLLPGRPHLTIFLPLPPMQFRDGASPAGWSCGTVQRRSQATTREDRGLPVVLQQSVHL